MIASLTPRQVDYLNIGLMILALAVAFVVPVELFVLAYAVLGPLHYLTEIRWLHERKYFMGSALWFPVLAIVLLIAVQLPAVERFTWHMGFPRAVAFLFAVAAAFVFLKDKWMRAALIVGAGIVCFYAGSVRFSLLFAILVPTIIHVWLFTAAFMLYGALKSRSRSGVASVAAFVVCSFVILTVDPDWSRAATDWGLASLGLFGIAPAAIGGLFGKSFSLESLATSREAVAVMRFIAFAYTYHYLNWFSKTSIIRWHETTPARMAAVGVLWLGAIGVYAWDYRLGFQVLFTLSALHVLLEFPLNHVSFAGIGKEIGAIVKERRAGLGAT
jgi:hypothetical protein